MRRGSTANRVLDFYIGIPLLNVLALFLRRDVYPEAIHRVGIMTNPALGDTLIASGPIQDVREAFPSQELILFATPSNVTAANVVPGIDRIELISLTRPLQAIHRLRSAQIDLMLDFTAWQRLTALLTLFSGAKYTLGFCTAGQHRHRGYSLSVAHRSDQHELANQRALAAVAGVKTGAPPRIIMPDLRVIDMVRQSCEVVVFHPWPSGTRSWLREWPEAYWVELAQQLARPGRDFVITGSPADQPRSAALRNRMLKMGVAAQVFVGGDGLNSVVNLLDNANLLVSVNTGIMHLGSVLGTPTVCINGPTAQGRWGPVGSRSIGVDTPDGTGGFLDLGFEFDHQPRDSMWKIRVEHVMKAIRELGLDAQTLYCARALRETNGQLDSFEETLSIS